MDTVITTFLKHSDTAYWKAHGIAANPILTEYRLHSYSTYLDVLTQVPNLVNLSILLYKMGSWKDQK